MLDRVAAIRAAACYAHECAKLREQLATALAERQEARWLGFALAMQHAPDVMVRDMKARGEALRGLVASIESALADWRDDDSAGHYNRLRDLADAHSAWAAGSRT